jgi:hypothetical protein
LLKPHIIGATSSGQTRLIVQGILSGFEKEKEKEKLHATSKP